MLLNNICAQMLFTKDKHIFCESGTINAIFHLCLHFLKGIIIRYTHIPVVPFCSETDRWLCVREVIMEIFARVSRIGAKQPSKRDDSPRRCFPRRWIDRYHMLGNLVANARAHI